MTTNTANRTDTNSTATQLPARLTGSRGSLPKTTVLTTGNVTVDDIGKRLEALHNELSERNTEFLAKHDRKAMARAEQADAAAFAEARLAGRNDPGSKHVDKLRAELAELARIGAGLKATIQRVDTEYRDAVANARPDLIAVNTAEIDKMRHEIIDVAGQLTGLARDADQHRRMARWLQGGPSTAGRPTATSCKIGNTTVPVVTAIEAIAAALTAPTPLEPVGYATTDRPMFPN